MGRERGTDLSGQEEGPATAVLSVGCECRRRPLLPSLPQACSSRAPASFVLPGSPALRAGGAVGGGSVSSDRGCPQHPPFPALHEQGGAGSCPPPGHEPVPAAPGTVAGTPGRLPRPPAHTHPRALALRALPASQASRRPSPAPGAPTPVLCSLPAPRPCPPTAHDPGPLPRNLGSSEAPGVASPPRAGEGGEVGTGKQADRPTDRVRAPACHLAPLQRDDGGQRRARR